MADPNRRDFLYIATGAVAAVGAAFTAWPFIDQMNPTASVLAAAQTDIELSPVAVGQQVVVKWRGHPLFVRRRTAKEIAEARDHAICALHITIHEGGDGVERVEQEVGLQLHSEHLKLGLSELRFEAAGSQLAYAIATVIFDGVTDAEKGPAGKHILMELVDRYDLHETRRVWITHSRKQVNKNLQVDDTDQDAGKKQHWQSPPPVGPANHEPPRDEERQRR